MNMPLKTWNLRGKRVIVRAGMNAPRANEKILDDFRLNAARATIDYILEKGGSVVLVTHLGRPDGYDEQLSTRILLPTLTSYGYDITFAATIDAACQSTAPVTLLENVRFFPEEWGHATGLFGTIKEKFARKSLAGQLARLGDYYVNDAFGVLHRTDISIALLPYQFSEENRSIGLLVERETQALDTLMGSTGTPKPLCLLLGGGKGVEKIKALESFHDPDISHRSDPVLIAPTLSFPFAAALGKNIGKSFAQTTESPEQLLFILGQLTNGVLPEDYQVVQGSLDGPLSYTQTDEIPNDYIGVSSGPKTVETFSHHLRAAKNIFFSGLFGLERREESMESVRAIIKVIAESDAFTVAAGGSTVAAIRKYGYESGFNHLSTGGGSALAYVAEQDLPGLDPFR